MNPNNSTLIIGLAGIVATLISSSLGIYYTAKARTAPLRKLLYSRQIELISKLICTQGRFRVYATIMMGNEQTFKDRARDDIGESLKKHSEFTDEAAAIFPTELWIEVKKLNSAMADLLTSYDETKCVKEEKLKELSAIDAKVALVSRAVLGVDELTEESLRLFSSTKEFEKLATLESKELERFAREKNV